MLHICKNQVCKRESSLQRLLMQSAVLRLLYFILLIYLFNSILVIWFQRILNCLVTISHSMFKKSKADNSGSKLFHSRLGKAPNIDRKSTRLNSSHAYLVCRLLLEKKKKKKLKIEKKKNTHLIIHTLHSAS